MRTTTFRTHLLQAATAFSISLMLTACGGGSGSQLDRATHTSSSSSSVNSSSSSVDTTQLQAIGRGSRDSFVAGEILLGVGQPGNEGEGTLSAGGVTTLTVNAVSGTNNLLTESIDVTFNSPCIARREAALSAPTVTTTNGEASVTYTAQGCVGADEITATTSYNGSVFSARGVLTVQPDTIGSVKYIDATPVQISLRGTGGQETSVVRFQVMGITEAPMKNVTVNFALNTTVGGISLVNATAQTDSAGFATTTVRAGTISTSVRVTATVPSTNISTQSSQLVISTGIPDQKSMSLAVNDFSPAAWQYNGVPVTVTVALADAFNNPVPNDTAVYFTTEGGQIDSRCLTADNTGTCTATWRSQDPRPERADKDYSSDAERIVRLLCHGLTNTDADEALSRCRASRAGRVTILASALGNESFLDSNGNGVYDNREGSRDTFIALPEDDDDIEPRLAKECTKNVPVSSASLPEGSPDIACDDLPEAYLDKNENGIRDNDEYFVDLFRPNGEGFYDAGDGKYNGALCIPDAKYNDDESMTQERWAEENNCTNSLVTIRKQILIVMACNTPLLNNEGRLPAVAGGNIVDLSSIPLAPGVDEDEANDIPARLPERKSLAFMLTDCNGNGLPTGTSISINSTAVRNATVDHSIQGDLPSSVEGRAFSINLTATGTEQPYGVFYINVTVPTLMGEITTTTNGIEIY